LFPPPHDAASKDKIRKRKRKFFISAAGIYHSLNRHRNSRGHLHFNPAPGYFTP
jgi:hypothetical protein